MGGSRSHLETFPCGKLSQNSPIPVLIFLDIVPCVFCKYINILLGVVTHFDLSMMGFQKSLHGVGGWVISYEL